MSAFWNTSFSAGAPSPVSQEVVFWLNGKRITLNQAAAPLTLATWLREHQGLTGTKVACATGDCGSCTVLVARPNESPVRWSAINACLRFMHQLHGCDVRTVEGLGADHALTPVQQALVDGHGTQCGMCTPGFVMQMTDVLQAPPRERTNSTGWWAQSLRGNLCRCTGYTAIFEAAMTAAEREAASPGASVPAFTPDWIAERAAVSAMALDLVHHVEAPGAGAFDRAPRVRTLRPATLEQALQAASAFPDSIVVAGATDLAVDGLPTHQASSVWLDIGGLGELAAISVERAESGTVLTIGALATWQQLTHVALEHCAPLAALLHRMGGPQIHSAATVGGNIMTASPIGDLLPMLVAMNATLVFAHLDGERRVPVSKAITGYRRIERRPGELLAYIALPLPGPHERLVLEKVSRRRDVDIATVSLAARWHRDANGLVHEVMLVAGGVGARVERLVAAEAVLTGSPGAELHWQQAAQVAADGITPRDDVRGSAAYRRRVLRQLIASLGSSETAGVPRA